jgi:hypothetical protein
VYSQKSCIRHRRRMGYLSDCFTRIIRSTFFIVSGTHRFCVYSQKNR